MPQPKLSFTTVNHDFFFALPSNPTVRVPSGSLQPNTDYYVSVEVKNPTTADINGTFKLTGGVFMIGNPPNQPPIIVNKVIAGTSGMSPWNDDWVTFTYHTGPSGHGCLRASIIEENGSPIAQPPCIYQNTNTIGMPSGQTSAHWFLVYLSHEKIFLNLVETPQPGSTTPTWHPKMVLPSGTPGQIDANGLHGYVGGTGIPLGETYLVELQVTPPPGAAGSHDFTIYGAFIDQLITDSNDPNFAGLVTVTVTVTQAAVPKSRLWLYGDGNLGGPNVWASPDIVLYDKSTSPATPVTQYGALSPNTAYGFCACIHNDGAEAEGVIVQFLRATGGVSSGAGLLSSVQVDIPPGVILVTSPVDFVSAPPNGHYCAWVRVHANNNETGSELRAYRNTNSTNVFPWDLIEIPMDLSVMPWIPRGPEPLPIDVNVKTHVLPAGWKKHPKIVSELRAANRKGTKNVEILQTPAFREMLKRTSLPIEVKAGTPERATPAGVTFKKDAKKQIWRTHLPPKLNQAPFVVTGRISKDAKPGEDYLVVVTAKYPKIGRFPAQSVQFRQLYHVVEKRGKPTRKLEQRRIRAKSRS